MKTQQEQSNRKVKTDKLWETYLNKVSEINKQIEKLEVKKHNLQVDFTNDLINA